MHTSLRDGAKSVLLRKMQASKKQNKYYGEIAQLARAHGSYPWCRGFKSLFRYLQEHPDDIIRMFLYSIYLRIQNTDEPYLK